MYNADIYYLHTETYIYTLAFSLNLMGHRLKLISWCGTFEKYIEEAFQEVYIGFLAF